MLEGVSEEIKTTLGEKIYFIFEGYDELPQYLQSAPAFAKLTASVCWSTLLAL